MPPHQAKAPDPQPRYGLARVLSKLGICSRAEAMRLIRAGRVGVNGMLRRDPEHPVRLATDRLTLDGQAVSAAPKVYLMLNKPRGLVTTAADEKGRATIWSCITDAALPPLHAVGRLDMASEGLLLLTNDTAWSAAITDPAHGMPKLYHVQINRVADDALLAALRRGSRDETTAVVLSAVSVNTLRVGEKTSWLEVTLDEGRNRHIRRMIEAQDCAVLRLVRVAIGRLAMGELAKGTWRHLTAAEVALLL